MTSCAEKTKDEILTRYKKRNTKSRRHHDNARKYLPGGDTRNVCHYLPYPTFIEKGKGCCVYDVDGNAYIDFVNNYTSLIHGHGHPLIVNAVQAQIEKGTIFGSPAECQYKFGQHLIKRIPSMDYIRFANSGTEATLFAMRAARCFTGKDVIIKMNGGYHGTHDYTWVNVLNPDVQKRKIPRTLLEYGTPSSVKADTIVAHFNDVEGVETLCSKHKDRIAAIILAPILATDTIILPEENYLEELRAICNRYDVLLIFDEVITFRLNEGGLQNMTGIEPDLTTLGKIIGGGFPIGAFGGRAEIMDQFNPEHPRNVLHSGTFNGNNMSMVAGLAAMQIYDQKEINRINKLGDRLRIGLNKAIKSIGLKSKAINVGSLISFLWRDTFIKDARDAVLAVESTKELNTYIHLELLNRGIFIAPREFYSVSTAMSTEEIDSTVNIFGEALEDLMPLISETNPDILKI